MLPKFLAHYGDLCQYFEEVEMLVNIGIIGNARLLRVCLRVQATLAWCVCKPSDI